MENNKKYEIEFNDGGQVMYRGYKLITISDNIHTYVSPLGAHCHLQFNTVEDVFQYINDRLDNVKVEVTLKDDYIEYRGFNITISAYGTGATFNIHDPKRNGGNPYPTQKRSLKECVEYIDSILPKTLE